MSFWDLIFGIIEKYFEFQKQIPIPGFEDVSLFDLKVALFITAIVISGLISVVPNAAYTVGEVASDRRRERRERRDEERERQAERDEIDRLIREDNERQGRL